LKLWDKVRSSSLWLVGFGLMLASSGLDGVYMSKWMPGAMGWLGFVLNTMSDIASLVIMYWFGRLQQSGKVKRRASWVLVPSEVVAVAYSWYFSWRQLRAVLPAVEAEDWEQVSKIAAGFIPLLLAFIGYAQSLLAGKLDGKPAKAEETRQERQEKPAQQFDCPLCVCSFGSQQALNAHMRRHKREQASNGNGKSQLERIAATESET